MEIPHIVQSDPVAHSPGHWSRFWHRQFAPEVTRGEIVFDLLFGVIVPILCFVFDPIVFRAWFMGPALFPGYAAFAYLFSAVQIVLLCFWLLTGPASHPGNRMIGGMLLAGAVFYAAVGVVLAPFSLDEIGAVGLIPFLTAMVYLRNSIRALRAGRDDCESFAPAPVVVLGTLLAAGLPLLLSILIHSAVSQAIDEIVKGDPPHAIFAARRVIPLRFFADSELEKMVNAYAAESDQQRKELLRVCYREITGENIENRLVILRD